ncbi:MAG: low molecular weight phosphatase family protein, partial [Actinomycetota bacterium]|nr:low molecular weight phosphatase family protein [Actinomycetota bacterium]
MEDDRFSILFVCTGNQCRSALGAVVTRTLTEGLPVEVTSAGTMVLPATPSPPETVTAASSLGYELGDHRSRPLTEVDASSFDLVIGFELQHIAAAVVDYGADRTKAFLLRQLVNLLEPPSPGDQGDQVNQAKALVAQANERRGATPPRLDDMVADPMGRSARTHIEAARTIDE